MLRMKNSVIFLCLFLIPAFTFAAVKINPVKVNVLQQLDQVLTDLGLLTDQEYPLQIIKRAEKLNIYTDDPSLKYLLGTILLSQGVHSPRATSTTVFLDRDHTNELLTVTINTNVHRDQKELTFNRDWQQFAQILTKRLGVTMTSKVDTINRRFSTYIAFNQSGDKNNDQAFEKT